MEPGPTATDRRLHELEAWARSRGWRPSGAADSPRRRRSARRAWVSVLTAMLLLAPMATLASDTFADVPDSHPFHDDINWVYSRRITTGCGGGNYCPEANVTRGQMAAFMHRGFGRISGATSADSGVTLSGSDQTVVTVNVDSGGVSGGTGMALVTASTAISISDATGCPCVVVFWLSGTGLDTIPYALRVEAGAQGSDSGALTWWFQVPSGVGTPINVRAKILQGTSSVQGIATVTAIYAPFGNAPV